MCWWVIVILSGLRRWRRRRFRVRLPALRLWFRRLLTVPVRFPAAMLVTIDSGRKVTKIRDQE